MRSQFPILCPNLTRSLKKHKLFIALNINLVLWNPINIEKYKNCLEIYLMKWFFYFFQINHFFKNYIIFIFGAFLRVKILDKSQNNLII